MGNLVCPASFDLGEKYKVAILSVTEGEEKPLKYPDMFAAAQLMVINKIDLAPMVGASLEVMDRDAKKMRGERPFIFSNLKTGQGLAEIIAFIEKQGLLAAG